MKFEELKDYLQETLILTQKTEGVLMTYPHNLYLAEMAEIQRRGDESLARLRESYDRLMRKQREQQPPAA